MQHAAPQQSPGFSEAIAGAGPSGAASDDLTLLRRRLLDDDGQLPAPLATAVASAMLAASVEAYSFAGRRPVFS